MTQVQKNTLISFIVAVILGMFFSNRVGQLYSELITPILTGSLFLVERGTGLDGFVFVYSLVLSGLMLALTNVRIWIKVISVGVGPILFIVVFGGNWKYFLALLATALLGGALGFGMRQLSGMLSSRKSEKAA